MTDASNSGKKPSTGPQDLSKLTAYATNSGPFIIQSNQIAMHSVERMMNLQADVLKASFNDMQGLVEKHGNPSPEVASEAFKLIVDKSMEHVRTTLAATQEMHKAYLDLMEGYLHSVRQPDPKKSKK